MFCKKGDIPCFWKKGVILSWKCSYSIVLEPSRARWCEVMYVAETGLEGLQQQVVPYICNSMIIWLHCFPVRYGVLIFCKRWIHKITKTCYEGRTFVDASGSGSSSAFLEEVSFSGSWPLFLILYILAPLAVASARHIEQQSLRFLCGFIRYLCNRVLHSMFYHCGNHFHFSSPSIVFYILFFRLRHNESIRHQL